MSKLVIVESPAKAKTIEKYLGKGFRVKASMGHLRDLPKKEMGVDLDHGFTPQYVPIEGKDKIIEELSELAGKSDAIYLATDPDREGEAISWHLKEMLHLPDDRTQRVTFNEITQKAVQAGIDHPRDIDVNLVDAQQARRILDRIVGYKLSPFLWKKVRRGLSAGRVQSVVTRMVVDKEREIRAFKPEEYWTIDLDLETEGKETFTASFYGNDQGKQELKNEEQSKAVVADVEKAAPTVGEVRRADKKKHPAPPFTTSTLQQEASRKLGMTSKRAMAVAQALYEGVELQEHGVTGLITYMRTDSLRLSADALDGARAYIGGRYGSAYLPAKPRVFKTKKNAQDAHEAIRPTHPELSPEEVKSSLTPDQYKLYRLIWSRFIACQMTEAVLDTVSADILAGGWIFRATGYQVKFPGFTAVYEESRDDAGEEKVKALPSLAAGMALINRGVRPEQHFTQPPARYTEASLIKAMEEQGVGRPSTYAPTLSIIQDRDYVAKEGKSLRPTPLGEAVTELMKERFTDIIDVKFTANMEEQLDEVETGEVDYRALLDRFYTNFREELETAEREMAKTRVKVKDEETDVPCELCGRMMVIKSGRFGKFLACPGYPECKNTKPITEDTGGICPQCGGKVVKKKSKNGYTYYACEKGPACNFMTWDVPQKKTCPQCGGTLFKRFNREEKKILCLKEGCGYFEELKVRAPKKKAEGEEAAPADKTKKTAKSATKKAAGTTAKKAAGSKAKSAEDGKAPEKKTKTKAAADGPAKKSGTKTATNGTKKAAAGTKKAAVGERAEKPATKRTKKAEDQQ